MRDTMEDLEAQNGFKRSLIRMTARERFLLVSLIAVALIVLSFSGRKATVIVQTALTSTAADIGQRQGDAMPTAEQKEICVDRNVIAPQGLGDIVLRLRPALIMAEVLGAKITSPRVETYHEYSTTEMLGLTPCNPAPVPRECILTTVFDAHAMDVAVERYCQRDTVERRRDWDGFLEGLRKFVNCTNMHLSYKADYFVSKTRCFANWTRERLHVNDWKRQKRSKSVLFHRRGGDVEQGVGVEGNVWSPDDKKYRNALRAIRGQCNDTNVTMVTQTKNITALREYYSIEGMEIVNGGDMLDVLKLASEFDVVLVGGGAFSSLIVQVAQPRLVLHHAKNSYSYDDWNDARLGDSSFNSSVLAAICAR